jgi:outer membrane protein OmpA-like peptidoglycan-associated protein
MKSLGLAHVAIALVCSALTLTAQTHPDAANCKDSPLISRFPGSYITDCKNMADDAFNFVIKQDGTHKSIEGELHQVTYNYPKTASKPQVVRNINTALHNAGYPFVYDSGDYGDFTVHKGGTWIMIEISVSNWYRQTIVKEISLTQDVVADAAALSTGINANGHIAATGILFDTGKADVKPESAAALAEIAKLLKQNPRLKLFVVGHTDNVGALAANLDLSKRRAASVVQALTTQYGITADRLAPYGNGSYAPISSNDSEDGRSQNRRVELVKQ